MAKVLFFIYLNQLMEELVSHRASNFANDVNAEQADWKRCAKGFEWLEIGLTHLCVSMRAAFLCLGFFVEVCVCGCVCACLFRVLCVVLSLEPVSLRQNEKRRSFRNRHNLCRLFFKLGHSTRSR